MTGIASVDNLASFSLYGDSEHYYQGMFMNFSAIREFLPDFIVVVHVDSSYPVDRINALCARGMRIVLEKNLGGIHGMYWRYFSTENTGVVIIRDADSRFSKRDAGLVRDWIASGKRFHIIRDNPMHVKPIMGGLWGVRGGIANIRELVNKYATWGNYADDEKFLEDYVFPAAKNDCLEHTSTDYHSTEHFIRIPAVPIDAGRRFNEYNQPL